MPSPVTVPTAPALSSLSNVELMRTGQWDISTGIFTCTRDDVAAAVAALDCPAVRRPILKLGHTDPRFDGEPAAGYIANLGVADSGNLLVGDYVGMPGWLGPIVASAYPDRSIEGESDYVCQLGHTHPFVLHAVALLGVTRPGIGTLASLQDVATLYGVAAASESGSGTPVTVTIRASKEPATMPNPRPTQVAAGVTTEDVRRLYYESAPYSVWICEMQLDPELQLIVEDDDNGSYARVPVTINGTEITFGTAVPVVIQYVDTPAPVAAAAGRPSLRYASRAESRPRASDPPPTLPATEPETIPEGGAAVALDEGLRTRLGLAADADEDAILAALDARLTAPPPTPAPAALPEGVVTIDAAALDELRAGARQGAEARAQQLRTERDTTIDAAMRAGKFPPARKANWETAWDADPEGTKAYLASLAPGLIPVDGPQGVAGSGEADTGDDALYASLFGKPKGA